MNFVSQKISLGLALSAFVFSGCVYTPGPGPVGPVGPVACSTDLSTLTVVNDAGEDVRVTIVGDTEVNYILPLGESQSDSLLSGAYRVIVVGELTGLILHDSTAQYLCDSAYELDLTPAQTPVPTNPGLAELDVNNDTTEVINVYVDSVFATSINPADTQAITFEPGAHTIQVSLASDPTAYLNETTETFDADSVVEWSVTAHTPIVEIQNQFALGTGECVLAFVDSGTAVQFPDGHFDVCQGETGIFSVTIDPHRVEVIGQNSSVSYYDDTRDFTDSMDVIYVVPTP